MIRSDFMVHRNDDTLLELSFSSRVIEHYFAVFLLIFLCKKVRFSASDKVAAALWLPVLAGLVFGHLLEGVIVSLSLILLCKLGFFVAPFRQILHKKGELDGRQRWVISSDGIRIMKLSDSLAVTQDTFVSWGSWSAVYSLGWCYLLQEDRSSSFHLVPVRSLDSLDRRYIKSIVKEKLFLQSIFFAVDSCAGLEL